MTVLAAGAEVHLDALTQEDCEQARRWRNDLRAMLRTPFMLTGEMQQAFYRDIVCNRSAPHRYWAVRDGHGSAELLIGMGGLTDLQWENGLAEISLLLGPHAPPGEGIGGAVVRLLLREGFLNMGLQTIFGECYICNPAVEFWRKMVERYHGRAVSLPRRKRWEGQLYDAYVFTFTAEESPIA